MASLIAYYVTHYLVRGMLLCTLLQEVYAQHTLYLREGVDGEVSCPCEPLGDLRCGSPHLLGKLCLRHTTSSNTICYTSCH